MIFLCDPPRSTYYGSFFLNNFPKMSKFKPIDNAPIPMSFAISDVDLGSTKTTVSDVIY